MVAPEPQGAPGQKARLARFEELSDFEYQKRNETNEIFIPVAERLGNELPLAFRIAELFDLPIEAIFHSPTRPARTCCASWRPVWTTSCTGPVSFMTLVAITA